MNLASPSLAIALCLTPVGLALPAITPGAVAHPLQLAQSSRTPEKTYMTVQSNDAIAIQITDGEFFFADVMYRAYDNNFTVTSGGVQVNYNRDTGNVLVLNSATGTEFYNYTFRETSSSSASGSQATGATPNTSLSPISDREIAAYITEGEFVFDGILTRTSGNTFVGEDGSVRVMYDQSAGRIVIINVVTGTEFYNYPYTSSGEGAL